MAKDYMHPKIGEEVTAIAGHYAYEKENTVPVNGKDVLYFLGYGVVDTSCCGMGGGRFAVVPGYVIRYKYRTGKDGSPVSEVEPIENVWETRKEIIRLIEERESFCDVRFLQ
jgi:hypothetical protein